MRDRVTSRPDSGKPERQCRRAGRLNRKEPGRRCLHAGKLNRKEPGRRCRSKKVGGGYRWVLTAAALAVVLLPAGLTSCVPAQESEELIVMDREEEGPVYTLALAVRGDVTLTRDIWCVYEQLVEEEAGFSVSGKRVSEVCVSLEDTVEKGQVLARLGDDGISDRIEELEYRIARNRKLLEHSRQNEDSELTAMELEFLYHSGRSEEEETAKQSALDAVRQRYRYEREDYEDAISLDTLELRNLQEEAAASLLTAGIDGTVEWIAADLKGSTSVKEEAVMRIVDDSECLFTVSDMTQAELFQEGTPVDMEISIGTAKGNYRLIPWQMENWETEGRLLFTLADDYGVTIEMGTSGTISVVLEKRENVVNIPFGALHTAEGKSFVYCLSEDGMREIRWVECGLYGDDSVEITSGLSEGERVILR